MLLSGAGDALGYRNQLWEYNESGPAIHQVGPGPTWKERERFWVVGAGGVLKKAFRGH